MRFIWWLMNSDLNVCICCLRNFQFSSQSALKILFYPMTDVVSAAEEDTASAVISDCAFTVPAYGPFFVLVINFSGDALIFSPSKIISRLDSGFEDDDRVTDF